MLGRVYRAHYQEGRDSKDLDSAISMREEAVVHRTLPSTSRRTFGLLRPSTRHTAPNKVEMC